MPPPPRRRHAAAWLLAAACALACAPAPAHEGPWSDLRDGDIVLFRHGIAPGSDDPRGMRLGDCSTQRNLDEAGRGQARRIGAMLRRHRVRVGAVLTSEWCRARDTAALAVPALPARADHAFNAMFPDRSLEREQTDSALATLLRWRGPGVLLVTTHQFNVAALAGIHPAPGEGVALRAEGGRLTVLGRLGVDRP
jgi:phosphohistidine phosphatase SixA